MNGSKKNKNRIKKFPGAKLKLKNTRKSLGYIKSNSKRECYHPKWLYLKKIERTQINDSMLHLKNLAKWKKKKTSQIKTHYMARNNKKFKAEIHEIETIKAIQ